MRDAQDRFCAPLSSLDVGEAKIFTGLEPGTAAERSSRVHRWVRRCRPAVGVADYCGYGRDSRERALDSLTFPTCGRCAGQTATVTP
jgi:hypothetical protein